MIKVNNSELKTRIEKNFSRLCEPYYQIEELFSFANDGWPGDKEGRALLAFASHYAINHSVVPCMEQMMGLLFEKTDGKLFFGQPTTNIINEQSLSGHSWYLRGLLEYNSLFHDDLSLNAANATIENIYLPILNRVSTYPLIRDENNDGGVDGHASKVIDGWLLSTDICCAFMCIDGLSHYYEVTEDERVKTLIDEMKLIFDGIDKVKIQAQTHCSLTAARGFVRMFKATGDRNYLDSAKAIFDLYIESGMTLTYQNFNWWGKGDTWTEPCAVVDSIMLGLDLYKIEKNETYRTVAARIWHNGFSALQVGNGGAGTTTCVSSTEHFLKSDLYEAYFCCTMRLAEGLRYMNDNKDLLYAESGELKKDEFGRYMAGDIIYAEVSGASKEIIDESKSIQKDGHLLTPIIKYYNLPREITDKISQQIVF